MAHGSSNPTTDLKKIKGTDVDVNTGNASSGTQRVVLATNQSTVPVSLASSPLPTGAATEATLASRLSESDFDTKVGSLTEAAPASDTASSGLNGRLQRIAQRLTSLIALIPTALGQGTMATSFKVVLPSDQSAIPASQSGTWNVTNISGTVSLPTGAATSANQSSELTLIGAVNETAPGTDTASSGLNGRLQRIAQRLTSLIALFPAALGQSTMANSFRVVVASDQSAIPVTVAAAATSIAKAEDAVHGAGDTGAFVLGRRIDTAAASSGASGDYEALNMSAEGAVWSALTPTTTSGCTVFRSLDLDETEEEVKATGGNVYGYFIYNNSASTMYLKFYNATAASVTVGTTTPVMTFPIPAGSAANVGFPYPVSFSTAITVAVVTGVADSSTGAPAANDCIVNIFYK